MSTTVDLPVTAQHDPLYMKRRNLVWTCSTCGLKATAKNEIATFAKLVCDGSKVGWNGGFFEKTTVLVQPKDCEPYEINLQEPCLQEGSQCGLKQVAETSKNVELTSETPPAASEIRAIVPVKPSSPLAKLDRARQMLAECRTLPDVTKIRDIAEAARVYAKAARLSKESQMYAAEIALLATHKAGQILSQLEKFEGGRPEKTPAKTAAVSEYARTLQETATPERTAQAWQQVGKIPATTVNAYLHQVKETHQDISQNGLLKFWMRAEKAQNPQPVQPRPVSTFGTQDFTAKITAFRTELGMLIRTMVKEATERAERIESAVQSLSNAEVAQ